MLNRTEVLRKAQAEFMKTDYPFTADIEDGRLVLKWRWKDGVFVGPGGISKEVSEFRYVVEVKDDGTFYGYDADAESVMALKKGGKLSVSGRSFIGHEVRIHKEIAVGKQADSAAGMQEMSFRTTDIHQPVRAFFEQMGYRYKEPNVTWIKMPDGHRSTYFGIGGLFSFIGIGGVILFLSLGLPVVALLPGLFLCIGIWSFLVAARRIPFPVFSTRFVLILTGLTFAVSFLAAFLALIAMYLLMR